MLSIFFFFEEKQQHTQMPFQTTHFECPYLFCHNRCNRKCTGYYGPVSGNRYCTEYHASFSGTCEKCGHSTDGVEAFFADIITGGHLRPDIGIGGYVKCKQCNHIYCYNCCFS